MARGKGFQGIVGLKKASTWGTEVVPGSGDGIEVTSLSVTGGLDLIPDDQITGAVTAKPSSNGNQNVEVELMTGHRYQGLETALALFFGTAGSPSTVDTSAYQHVIKPKTDFDGIFGTLAYEYIKDTAVAAIPSLKWTSCTIGAKQGERVKVTLKGIGDTWTDSSSNNTTTTIDTITLPSNREYATFAQCSFLMNNQSAGSLASAAVYVNEWELTFERPHKANITTERGNKTSEPLPSGFMTGKAKFGFSVVDSGTGGNSGLLADQLAGTAKKVKIVLTGSSLAGASTQYFGMNIWLPYVQLLPGAKPAPSEPGAIAWTQEAELHHASSTPTGFTSGYTDMVTLDIFSQRSTDALA